MSRSLEIPTHLICVAPTGSGKSLIYEKLSKFRKVLLVTPLVALARQQASHLLKSRIVVVESKAPKIGFDGHDSSGVWIVSPEKLQLLFSSLKVSSRSCLPDVVVIDECHCLWEWGKAFRPSFEVIPLFIETFGIPHSLWLTATLPFDARVDLKKRLNVSFLEMGSFALPPNLKLTLEYQPKMKRPERVLYWLRQMNTEGILFVGTRLGSERVARLLKGVGIQAQAYHAGLSHEERLLIEKQVEKKELQWVVATSAFGMGMNYRHLKAALLWEPPPSLLAYVQAIGRVGRSEDQATAIGFWSEEDFDRQGGTADEQRARSEVLRYYSLGSERETLLRNYFRS